MNNCAKTGCGALIGDDSYCTRCGTAAKPPVAPLQSLPQPVKLQDPPAQPAPTQAAVRRCGIRARRRRRSSGKVGQPARAAGG